MANEIATAYVSLVPETRDLKKGLIDAFKDIESEADKTGRRVGQKIGENVGKGTEQGAQKAQRGLRGALSKALGDSGVTEGRRFIGQFNSAVGQGVTSSGVGRWMAGFRAEAQASGNAAGLLIGKTIGAGINVGVGVALAGVGATIAGLGYSLSKGFERLKTIDRAEFQLKALGYSLQDVEKISKDVTEVVTGTPIALEEAFGSAVMFLGAGVEQGEELNRILTAISDAAGFSGSSFQDLAIIFSQVMNMGKLQAGDLLQLHQRNIPVQKWIQKELQITAEEYADMSREGQISMEHLLAAVENNLGGMAKRMGDTLEGALSNARTAAARVGATLITALSGGDTENITSGIGEITDALDNLNNWIKAHQPEIISAFGAIGEATISMAGMSTEAVSRTLIGLGELIGGLGNTLGFLNKYVVAPINEVMGRSDIAEQLRQTAEEQFAWGEAMKQAGDDMKGLIDSIESGDNKWKNHIDNTKNAAIFARDLGDAVKKAQAADGGVILKAPTAEDLNKIDEAKYRIEQIPDSVDFRVIPKTEEATAATDAWREKEEAKTAEIPADADTKPAEQSAGAWRTDEEGRVVRVPVDVRLEQAHASMNGFVEQWSKALITPSVAPGSHIPGGTGGPGGYFAPQGGMGADTGGSILPQTQALKDRYHDWGFTDIGGYRPPDGFNEHSSGKAIDVMIPNWDSEAGKAAGNAVMIDALRQPNVEYVIWRDEMWYPDGTRKPYTGYGSNPTPTQAHRDHVHIKTKAAGGPIYGPGTGTSDSIPAWLSNGEHVIPADEVRKAGGQTAIYRMRAMLRAGALPGFQSGGHIDKKLAAVIDDIVGPGKDDPKNPARRGPNRDPGRDKSQIGLPRWGTPGQQWGDPPPDWWLKPIDPDDYLFPEWWPPGMEGIWRHPYDRNRIRPLGFASGGAAEDDKWLREQAAAMGMPVEDLLDTMAEGMQVEAGKHEGHGRPPGPGNQQARKSGRKEGYIPAAAGSTAVSGKSALAGFINMGAEVINGLIDQAASAASTAAAAGIAGGTMGVGAAGGSQAGAAAADFAIGLGANAAKRGVSYAFQLGSIWTDALLEQVTPFGMPRWLTADYTGFMPRLDINDAITSSLEEATAATLDPANTTVHGQSQGAPPGPPDTDALDFISRATQAPEPVPPPDPVMVHVDTINATDAADVGQQIAKRQKLASLQYGGRPL